MAESYQNSYLRSSVVAPALIVGFGAGLIVWCVWFATHIPWLGWPESTSLPIVLLSWCAGLIALLKALAPDRGLGTGAASGLVSALVSLIVLGTKIAGDAAPTGEAGAVKPNTALIVIGFLALGTVLGLLASGTARALSTRKPEMSNRARPWLARFAIVSALAVVPLLVVGGLVTSTDSGMAVPDWPGTFGSNMFLYPLGARTPPDRYLEHSHRLFGTLVGLCAIVMAVWAWISGASRWSRWFAVFVLGLVILQGLLGASRVLEDKRALAMLHGVLAQLVFGSIVALAAYLSPTFGRGIETSGVAYPTARRLQALSTGLLHVLVIQLIFGAVSRHFRGSDHATYTHAAFSIVVVIMAAMAGFAAGALPSAGAGRGVATLKRVGTLLVVVVVIQFILGWVAFIVRGKTIQAETPLEAILRTAHQANGALLLALTCLGFVWSRWLLRGVRAAGSWPILPTTSGTGRPRGDAPAVSGGPATA